MDLTFDGVDVHPDDYARMVEDIEAGEGLAANDDLHITLIDEVVH